MVQVPDVPWISVAHLKPSLKCETPLPQVPSQSDPSQAHGAGGHDAITSDGVAQGFPFGSGFPLIGASGGSSLLFAPQEPQTSLLPSPLRRLVDRSPQENPQPWLSDPVVRVFGAGGFFRV